MSTQDDSGISFSILPEESQQHFRLLELPPDLLSLITSEEPPTLQFKSTEAAGQAPEANAVICTSDKTYNIRQVNTSNSVYITHAVNGEQDLGSGRPGQPAVQAIAQSNFTLELTHAANVSAIPYLKAALPVYSSSGHYQQKDTSTSKEEVFQHIPLSNVECERDWTELACFQSADPPRAFLPAAKARVQAWRSILNAAIANGIDLTAPLNAEQFDLIIDVEEEWPVELSQAVLRSFSPEAGSGDVAIDEDRCVRLTGLNELESRVGFSSTTHFVEAWADALPEKWRGKAQLELLKGNYQVDGQQIVFVESVPPGTAGAKSDSAGAKSSLGAKRKWHDKFRASKKAAS